MEKNKMVSMADNKNRGGKLNNKSKKGEKRAPRKIKKV